MQCKTPVVLLAGFLIAASSLAAQNNDNGCRTGGAAIANAFVLSNPMYSLFLRDFESYLEENSEHFQRGGDAIRCARALSKVFANTAFSVVDPAEEQSRRAMQDHLNTELGTLGIPNDGSMTQPSPALEYLQVSMQLARLARGLPAATEGDFEPYNTPANEMEQMRIWAENTYHVLLQDPQVASIFRQLKEPLVEIAKSERQMIFTAAQRIATKSSGKDH
jgi:hypothetical protein